MNGGLHDSDILRASLFADAAAADGLPPPPPLLLLVQSPMERLLISDDVEKSALHDDDNNDVELVVRGQWVATESTLREEAPSLARSKAADTMVHFLLCVCVYLSIT